jgi:hypothetical protein
MSKPCMRLGQAQECATCGSRADEDCPYETMSEGLKERPKIQVRGGNCSGDDDMCQSCQ